MSFHNKTAHTPKATGLPANPYRNDVLRAFLATHLEVVGEAVRIKDMLSNTARIFISGLPSFMQVSFVDGMGSLVLGARDDLPFVIDSDKKRGLNGQYLSEKRQSLVALESRDRGYVTAAHEFGHLMDDLFGENGKPLSANPHWHRALERETDYQKAKGAHAPLYTDYRPLRHHLFDFDYTEVQRPSEAMAEMFCHVATLMRNGGNFVQIDRKLDKIYPFLWPEFRDHAIPRVRKKAARLYAERRAQERAVNTFLNLILDIQEGSIHRPHVHRGVARAMVGMGAEDRKLIVGAVMSPDWIEPAHHHFFTPYARQWVGAFFPHLRLGIENDRVCLNPDLPRLTSQELLCQLQGIHHAVHFSNAHKSMRFDVCNNLGISEGDFVQRHVFFHLGAGHHLQPKHRAAALRLRTVLENPQGIYTAQQVITVTGLLGKEPINAFAHIYNMQMLGSSDAVRTPFERLMAQKDSLDRVIDKLRDSPGMCALFREDHFAPTSAKLEKLMDLLGREPEPARMPFKPRIRAKRLTN